jgi:glycosyltransferase involved in cell wall biosynthesis
MKKIIVLCCNYEPVFPKEPDEGNRFFTYGFGANIGINLKKFIPEYEIEVWRLDHKAKKYYEKNLLGIVFKVFPSFQIKVLSDFSLRVIKKLKAEIKKNNPILFVPFNHYGILYQVAFFFPRSPIVTSHHGGCPPKYDFKYEKGLRKLRALIKVVWEKLSIKNVDYFFVGETKELDYLKEKIINLRHHSWGTGINISDFPLIPKEEARKLLGWDNKKKYILYVGKLYKYKQVDELIKLWKEIKKTRPEIELVLAGNESPESWGEEYYSMAVESGALVLGRVLNVELYKYYCAADVYVLVSLRDDYFGGMGIAPLESLACNTPVVSNALRNYFGDNVNELGEIPNTLEEYKEAIIKVIDCPGNYKNMRESMVRLYSRENIYKSKKFIFDGLAEQYSKSKQL